MIHGLLAAGCGMSAVAGCTGETGSTYAGQKQIGGSDVLADVGGRAHDYVEVGQL